MGARPPVKDWATDFDHLDARWINDPFPIWDEMRARCPIAHTERFMGVYFPSRYEDVRAVAYDTDHFSSRRVVVRETPPPRIPAPPITSDPPEHRSARMVLLPPLHAECDEETGAQGPHAVQRAHRQVHRARHRGGRG
jgi:cytochrome P450